jgi:hypothetical protein
MKYYKIKYIIIFFFGFIVFSFAQAKLEIKDAKKNFGFVKKGEVVKVLYEISNAGNAPLILSDIEIGCSCTTAEYDKKPLLPAQTSTVTIIFDTKTVYDRQDRVVLLHSNDGKSPHKLRYKGVVLK